MDTQEHIAIKRSCVLQRKKGGVMKHASKATSAAEHQRVLGDVAAVQGDCGQADRTAQVMVTLGHGHVICWPFTPSLMTNFALQILLSWVEARTLACPKIYAL